MSLRQNFITRQSTIYTHNTYYLGLISAERNRKILTTFMAPSWVITVPTKMEVNRIIVSLETTCKFTILLMYLHWNVFLR